MRGISGEGRGRGGRCVSQGVAKVMKRKKRDKPIFVLISDLCVNCDMCFIMVTKHSTKRF